MVELNLLKSINDTLFRIEKLLQTGDAPSKRGMSPGFNLKPNKSNDSETKETKITQSLFKNIGGGTKDTSRNVASIVVGIDNITTILTQIRDQKSIPSKETPKKGNRLLNLIPDLFKAKTVKDFNSAKKSTSLFERMTTNLKKGILNMADVDDQKISSGIANMITFGNAFSRFAKQVSIGSLIMLPSLVILPVASLAILGLGQVFKFLGGDKNNKQIEKGAKTLGLMGKSLVGFSLGIGTFSLVFAAIATGGFGLLGGSGGGDMISTGIKTLGIIGAGMLTIYGMSLLYSHVGKNSKNIIQGSKAVGIMSLSLVGLSLGLWAINKTPFLTADDKWEKLGMLTATLGTLAITYGLAGKFWTHITFGSIAFVAIGLSLIPLAWGFKKLYESEYFGGDPNWEKFGFLSATLGGLGLIYTGLGAAGMTGLPFVGAAVMGAIGLSLMALGSGVSSMFDTLSKYDDIDKVGEQFVGLMGNIGLGMLAFSNPSILTGGDSKGGFFKSIGNFLQGGLNTVQILAASAAITTTSLSLSLFSKSLKSFMESGAIDGSYEDIKSRSDSMAYLFANMGTAFAIEPKKVMLMQTGAAGITSVGQSLIKVSKGLKSWYKDRIPDNEFSVRKGFGSDEYEGETTPISMMESIISTLNAIQKPFELIGSSKGLERGFLGKIFNGDRNAVKDGIDAVKGTQGALTSVKKGLDEWYKNRIPHMEFKVRDNFGSDEYKGDSTPTSMMESIISTLNAIQAPFAAIGMKEGLERGFLGKIFAGKRNSIKDGIDAVKETQGALTSVKKGLDDWYKNRIPHHELGMRLGFGTTPELSTPTTLLESIVATFTAIQEPFAAIGSKEGSSRGLFGDLFMGKRNAVAEGITAIKGTGEELSNISNALMGFKGINPDDLKMNITFDSKTGEIITKGVKEFSILDNILASTMLISQVFSQIGEMENSKRTSILGIRFGKGDVTKGASVAQSSADTLKNLADGLSTFKDLGSNQNAADNAVNMLKTYIDGMVSLKGISPGDNKTIMDVLDKSNKYLNETKTTMQKIVDLSSNSKTSSGLKAFNTMFNDMAKLPHDKISNMFKEMRLSIEEMKNLNQVTLTTQLDLYKTQLSIIEAEIKKITTSHLTQQTVTQQPNNNNQNQQNQQTDNKTNDAAILSVMLQQIKASIEELNDNFISGQGKVKITNFDELSLR
jgi:hypothetical protein